MFNDKPYFKVNREERFFCALFAHTVLASQAYREELVDLARRRFDIALDPHKIEVYLEVAALRDYWNDLGDPAKYTRETHNRRRAVLDTILTMRGIGSEVIERGLALVRQKSRTRINR